ncbi:tripartite tricarboxylate transporter TctB family protein [Anaeromyxobacter oryzae]|uniref:DUF1468 domain-containing protein n=1 Tax=Anaeromyxobacter oryzae TaxID=2918170 RepID=A0ABM7WXF6_9BACT|nr:tripartite tricarboxylate transporter TctB family protein [Anaeromyxobacter oryzae]BDG04184.1 hypothetical protein AMOR_31800 [Anaeromyxobacter oryzae]
MVSAMKVVTRARVEGLVICLVALGYLVETQRIPSLFQMPGVPGPTAFPTLVGLVFAAAGFWRLVTGGGRLAAVEEAEPVPPAPAPAVDAEPTRPAPAPTVGGLFATHGRFYAMWAVVLAYLALMPAVGFPIATAVSLVALFALLGERRWPVGIGIALATTAVLYLGFGKGLGVRLPLGLLERLVK